MNRVAWLVDRPDVVADASDLGLPPGTFPSRIEAMDSHGRDRTWQRVAATRDAEGDLVSVRYVTTTAPHERLDLYND